MPVQSCPVCPMDATKVTTDYTYWRVVNMVGAWRDQLLEVMGAMGVREARRLRGQRPAAPYSTRTRKGTRSPTFREVLEMCAMST